MQDTMTINDGSTAALTRGAGAHEEMAIHGTYHVVCQGGDGKLKWEDTIHNLVTNVAKNRILDVILGNISAGAVVMGLKGVGTAAATDTQVSHPSWLEVGLANAPTYSGNRKTPVFSAASSLAKSTSAVVVFNITGTGTVAGCFINIGGSSTIDNTSGTLFSAGNFTVGNKLVDAGDTLSVTYTASLTAAPPPA